MRLPGGCEQVGLDLDQLPELVEGVELGQLVAVVERVPAHDVVVARLDGGPVVLPVGAASGLLDVPLLEPGDHVVVDELAAVVAVERADPERDARLDRLQRAGEHRERVVARAGVLRPARGEIHYGQGAAELAHEGGPAVGDGVGLDRAGQAVELVAGLPDRDAVAQRLRRRPGGADPPEPGGVARGLEVAVDGGRAHRHELVGLAVREPVQLAGRLQRGQPLGQHGLQVLAAGHVRQQPHLFQQPERAGRIACRSAPAVAIRPGRSGFVEQAPGRAPPDAQGRAHPVEYLALALLRRLRVLRPEPFRYLPFRGHTDPVVHTTSQPPNRRFRAHFL